MSTIAKLTEAVAAVCPVEGVSVGEISDRRTWRIMFAPAASQPQKDAARAVLDAFDWDAEQSAIDAQEQAERRDDVRMRKIIRYLAQKEGMTMAQFRALLDAL